MRKSCENSVYSDTEKRILRALNNKLKEKRISSIKTNEISREAGIANSSFYNHYRSLSDLLERNEKKILEDIGQEVRKLLRKKDYSIEKGYELILLKLYQHRDFLSIIIKIEGSDFFQKMSLKLKPFITRKWIGYGASVDEKIFRQLSANITEEIKIWRSERFSPNKISKHAHNLTTLTNNAQRNYAPIYYS